MRQDQLERVKVGRRRSIDGSLRSSTLAPTDNFGVEHGDRPTAAATLFVGVKVHAHIDSIRLPSVTEDAGGCLGAAPRDRVAGWSRPMTVST